MDTKDRKILMELVKDCRSPISVIARNTRLSRDSVRYRIKLLENSVIKKYKLIIDLHALGYKKARCHLVLKNNTIKDEENVIDALEKNDYVSKIIISFGTTYISFSVYFRDDNHLQEIINSIENKIHSNIRHFFYTNLLIEEKTFYERITSSKFNKLNIKQSPDAKDMIILKELNEDAHMSLVDLSRNTGLNQNTISYRIRELKKKGVIKSTTISVDLAKVGLEFYNIQIKTNRSNVNSKIIRFIGNIDPIVYYCKYFDNKEWDIDLGLITEKRSVLRKMIRELKEQFQEKINFREIYFVDRVIKEGLPKGIFFGNST